MASRSSFIRSGILGEFKTFLSPDGQRYEELARKVGLPTQAHADPVERLPLEATMRLFDLAAKQMKNPALAIAFAGKLKPKTAGLIGEIIVSAPTVRDGLRDVESFINVFMAPFEVTFCESDGLGVLEWRYPEAVTAPRVQYNLFMVASFTFRLRLAIGPD